MRAWIATSAGRPDAPNEDFAAVTSSSAVLLDGAGTPPEMETGCSHGVAWFARTLGALLLGEVSDPGSGSLADCLSAAIGRVRLLHEGACDLAHPGTPTSTVVAIRVRDGRLDYLVLADSALVLTSVDGGTRVISDHRVDDTVGPLRAALDRIPPGDPGRPAAYRRHIQAVSELRNKPGGFWVASADPAVAGQALTGSCPLPGLASALLVSDGASRLADLFSLVSWDEVAAMARRDGPAGLIRQVRAAEAADPDGARWRRTKAFDDATAVSCDRLE